MQASSFTPELSYTIITRDEKVEKKCTLYPLRGREDLSFRSRHEPGKFSENSVLLFPGGEPLTKEHAGDICSSGELEIVLIDTRWKKANGVMNYLPQLKKVTLQGYQTGAVRRDPPPKGGLASIEALYLSSMILGNPDETLLEGYHFRERFLNINGLETKIIYENSES